MAQNPADVLARLPGLGDWMRLGLYDAEAGYYASGRVRFGHERDFWTFPERLSPAFGRLIAVRLAAARDALVADGAMADGDPFTAVELGAGDGSLARDVCDAVDDLSAMSPSSARLAACMRYRIGERSPALQDLQRTRLGHHHGSRADHLSQGSADLLARTTPFTGVILHNELLDVWPHELVCPGVGGDATLLRLVAWLDEGTWAQWGLPAVDPALVAVCGAAPAAGLWPLETAHLALAMRRAAHAPSTPLVVTAVDAPLVSHPDAAKISAWLVEIADLVGHRREAHSLPPHLVVCPGIGDLVAWAAANLRAGWMWTIDYGGTALHSLDPWPGMPLVRVYPEPRDGEGDKEDDPVQALLARLTWPGSQDVTVDIDFSHLAAAGRDVGLMPVWHGPQGGVAAFVGAPNLLAAAERRVVEARLRHRAGVTEVKAAGLVWSAASRFLSGSPGFHLLVQRAGGGAPLVTQGSWPVLPESLVALRPDATEVAVQAALGSLTQGAHLAERLRPSGCLYASLDEAGHRDVSAVVIDKLDGAGLLRRFDRQPIDRQKLDHETAAPPTSAGDPAIQ